MAKDPYRLIPNIVDQFAQDEPDKLFAELPISHTDFTAGFRPITYAALANAVNGVAWWLTETLGPAGTNFPTVAYVGLNDMCNNLLIIGAVKAGYKMLFTSPLYSSEAQVRLLKAVNCKAILTSSIVTPMSEIVEQVAEKHGDIQVYQVPMTTFFLDGKYESFPYEKSFEEAHDEPLVVLHTSGTTGFPKPVIWTHDWAASFALQRYLDPPEGYESFDRLILGTRVFSLFPQFHAGHFMNILFAYYSGTVVIMPPALAHTDGRTCCSGIPAYSGRCFYSSPSSYRTTRGQSRDGRHSCQEWSECDFLGWWTSLPPSCSVGSVPHHSVQLKWLDGDGYVACHSQIRDMGSQYLQGNVFPSAKQHRLSRAIRRHIQCHSREKRSGSWRATCIPLRQGGY